MVEPILVADNLVKHYPAGGGRLVRAVDGVEFSLQPSETLALVGESGCGKSTLARLLLRLEPATAGRVVVEGTDLTALSARALRPMRKRIQMIFQDPYASLDPRMNAEAIVREPLDNFGIGTPDARRARVRALLARVGFGPHHFARYPHEFSGGQRQRLGIARALALEPGILIADEPVSALDVSIRAQVLNLLSDLKREFGLTLLIVSHDIGVVAHVSDRVAVMYLGRIVEIGRTETVLDAPLHPYSRALLDSVPAAHPGQRRVRAPIEGDPPSPFNPPPGCRFHPRCPFAMETCRRESPELRAMPGGRMVACHRADDSSLDPPPSQRMMP